MQDTTGTSIATNAEKAIRSLSYQIEVAWDGVNYVDETARLKSLDWDWRFGAPEQSITEPGAGYAAEATVVFYNDSGRYSPFQSASPIYAQISGGQYYLKPTRIYVGFEGENLRIFTGYLYIPREPTRAGDAAFTCRDRSATIIQKKATTFVYTGLRTDEWLVVLCALVSISAGDQIFDVGTQIIPYCWLDDESVWEQMVLVAAAEGGFLYFDWAGKLHFENGAHWTAHAAHTVSQYTLTRGKFSDVQPEQRPQEVFNEVTVEYSPRVAGPTQKIYALDKPISIPPSGTHHLIARLQWPATSILTPRRTNDDDTDYIVHLATGDRSDASLTIDPNTENKFAQRYECDLINNNANHAIIISKFQVRGTPLLGDPSGEVKETRTSVVAHARTKEVRRNPYIQTRAQAAALASFLADRYVNPRTLYTVNGVPGLPQLELGDRVTIQEARLLSTDRTGLVLGIHASLGAKQPFTMGLDVIDDASLLQKTSYFIIGTHKWGTGAGSSYLWYGGTVEDSWTDLPDAATGHTLTAAYLSTLVANLNYVHGLAMGIVPAINWNVAYGSTSNPWAGRIWHQHRYLRYVIQRNSGTVLVKVNNVTVVTIAAGSLVSGVADLNSLGLAVGTMYSVEMTGGDGYVVELAEQIDSAWPVTPPSWPTFVDGNVSAAADLNLLRDSMEWCYARARNPVLPFLSHQGGSGAVDVFPPNWMQVWYGLMTHRHATLKARIRHSIYLGMRLPWRIKILVTSTATGNGGDMATVQYEYTPAGVDALLKAGWIEDKSIALTGGTALDLVNVQCFVQRDYVAEDPGDTNRKRDDNTNFGLDWAYEDGGGAKIASWVALPTFTHGDQPTAANLNKLSTDGALLAAVARSANRPTPLLSGHAHHIRHTHRWLKYLSYSHSDGKGGTAYDEVRISWADNEATLPKTDASTWATYDLAQAAWLFEGVNYRIEGADYALETPTA